MADDDNRPVGFPCRNTEVLILNDENRLAKVDEPGEICVRGSSLAVGYWNNPERTAKGFVQNPLNPHYPELIYRSQVLTFGLPREIDVSAAGFSNQTICTLSNC